MPHSLQLCLAESSPHIPKMIACEGNLQRSDADASRPVRPRDSVAPIPANSVRGGSDRRARSP